MKKQQTIDTMQLEQENFQQKLNQLQLIHEELKKGNQIVTIKSIKLIKLIK